MPSGSAVLCGVCCLVNTIELWCIHVDNCICRLKGYQTKKGKLCEKVKLCWSPKVNQLSSTQDVRKDASSFASKGKMTNIIGSVCGDCVVPTVGTAA